MLFLVDFENTQLRGFFGLNLLTEKDKVILFRNSSQKNIPKEIAKELISKADIEQITLVKQEKNGLDFYISVCVGDYLSKNPKEEIAIISNDRGYVAVCDYCKMIYKNKVILAPDICNAINILKNNLPVDFFNNDSKNVVEIKKLKELKPKFEKEEKNKEMCAVAKIVPKNLELVEVFEKSKTAMGFYSNLVKKYGKTEGHRIYHSLKDAGYKCSSKE